MGTGILTILAGTFAFLIFCLTRGQKMREEKRIWPELLWYAGGLVPLAAVTIIWTAMENQVVPQRILLIAIGAALGGLAFFMLGEVIRPSVAASATPGETVVSQNAPTINTWNQSGGTNTIIIGTPTPPRLAFDQAIANDLVSKLPKGKPIMFQAIGYDEDQAVANQYFEFLKARGFNIPERNIIGAYFPPPTEKISVLDEGARVVVTVAPSAH